MWERVGAGCHAFTDALTGFDALTDALTGGFDALTGGFDAVTGVQQTLSLKIADFFIGGSVGMRGLGGGWLRKRRRRRSSQCI